MAIRAANPDLPDQIALAWTGAKTLIEQNLAINNDAVHVLIGMVLLFGFALILRRPVSRVAPWLAVAILTLINEWSDLRTERWPDAHQQWAESFKDIGLTVALPTLILLIARFRPQLLR